MHPVGNPTVRSFGHSMILRLMSRKVEQERTEETENTEGSRFSVFFVFSCSDEQRLDL